MSLASFYKLFPVPDFLKLSTIGLDISDESIKFAELVSRPGGYRLGRYGDVDLPAGVVVSGKIANRQVLIDALTKIKKENGFSYVQASLPEEESFVVRMGVPWVRPSELPASIELQLEEYIPMPADQVTFDYEIYRAPKDRTGNYVLSVFSVPKTMVADYSSVLHESGLEPASLELEVQSGARSLVPLGDQGTYMIADLGKTRTGFTIVSRGVVMFTSTIKSVGGENLTKAVQKYLNVSFEEAEQEKIKHGLLNSPNNKEIFEALVPIVSLFKDEINRHFSYWENLRNSHEVEDPISRVIFCGGQATLPGLVEYISSDLPVPVGIGNPWSSFMQVDKEIPPLDFNNSLRYGTAIGLALRGAVQ